MRNASSQQGKNEQQWEKKNAKLEHKQQNLWWAHTTFFSIKCVTRKFQVVVVQNNGKEMYKETKKCAACAKFFFFVANQGLLIFLQFSLPSPFSIAWFYFSFE